MDRASQMEAVSSSRPPNRHPKLWPWPNTGLGKDQWLLAHDHGDIRMIHTSIDFVCNCLFVVGALTRMEHSRLLNRQHQWRHPQIHRTNYYLLMTKVRKKIYNGSQIKVKKGLLLHHLVELISTFCFHLYPAGLGRLMISYCDYYFGRSGFVNKCI